MDVKVSENQISFKNEICYCIINLYECYVEISVINVLRKFRNQGYASRMLNFVINFIKTKYNNFETISLSPLPLDSEGKDLKNLIKFYTKFGFRSSHNPPRHKPYLMTLDI